MNLALGKKRRNNDEEERMMVLVGEANAAINASKCQETMFDLLRHSEVEVPDEVYKQAIQDCDGLKPLVSACIDALRKYREKVDKVRMAIANREEPRDSGDE